jgi:hypothetical protein
MTVVYQYSSTRISGGGATANDVRHVTESDIITGDMFCACLAFSRFFFTIVVQNVPGLPEMTKRSCDPKRVPLGWGVCMRNRKFLSPEVASSNVTWPRLIPLEGWGVRKRYRKLRNIRSNVTRKASPGKYGSVHAQLEVHLECSLGHPRPIIVF